MCCCFHWELYTRVSAGHVCVIAVFECLEVAVGVERDASPIIEVILDEPPYGASKMAFWILHTNQYTSSLAHIHTLSHTLTHSFTHPLALTLAVLRLPVVSIAGLIKHLQGEVSSG